MKKDTLPPVENQNPPRRKKRGRAKGSPQHAGMKLGTVAARAKLLANPEGAPHAKTWRLIDPEGARHECRNLAAFMRARLGPEKGRKVAIGLRQVARWMSGRLKIRAESAHGWTLAEIPRAN